MGTVAYLSVLVSWTRARLALVHDETGSPTLETMIIAGVLAAAAIAAGAIVVSKIMSHANQIQ
jgi:hypothetical protein